MYVRKRERCKVQISLRLVYCSSSDVVVSGFFYTFMGAATVFSLGVAAVYSGKQYEFNLQWRQSLVSREGWCSAGTRVRHWSSWIHLGDCWGSKHTWHESTEVDVNKYSKHMLNIHSIKRQTEKWVLQVVLLSLFFVIRYLLTITFLILNFRLHLTGVKFSHNCLC